MPTRARNCAEIVRENEMNGTLAQIVALTCFCNALLSGHKVGSFFPQNSTCIFCDRVNFVIAEKRLFGKLKEKEVAKTPDEWFVFLKSSLATGIRLLYTPTIEPKIPDRLTAGFVGGGGTWAMEVFFPRNKSEVWTAQWVVWDKNASDKRGWRVTYRRTTMNTTSPKGTPDLSAINKKLTKALIEIHSFSSNHHTDYWTKLFANALETLNSEGKILYGYHKDLAPDGFLSIESKTILDACQTSMVFGGMGSWNDVWFEKGDKKDPPEEYNRVSDQLFNAINESILAAVNSRCSPEKISN
jgi:hypothetical protein